MKATDNTGSGENNEEELSDIDISDDDEEDDRQDDLEKYLPENERGLDDPEEL